MTGDLNGIIEQEGVISIESDPLISGEYMRITDQQALVIKKTILRFFGEETSVMLFGSRADDNKRGGDIDIYIECANLSTDELLDAKINTLVELKKLLGEQKIDLVINRNNGVVLPIYEVAKKEGIVL